MSRLHAFALLAALGLALAAAARVESPAPEASPAVPRAAEGGEVPATAARPAADLPEFDPGRAFRAREAGPPRDVFAARSWAPPPPPPRSKAEDRPVAPPLPFRYSGRMEDEDGVTVFLLRGDVVVPARVRENIDASYRLEAVGPNGVVITYLPLAQQQILPFPQSR